jgi:hypothetical protein
VHSNAGFTTKDHCIICRVPPSSVTARPFLTSAIATMSTINQVRHVIVRQYRICIVTINASAVAAVAATTLTVAAATATATVTAIALSTTTISFLDVLVWIMLV